MRRKGFLVATAASLAAVAVPAFADELGTAGGVRYQSASVGMITGQSVLLTQQCARGEKATGAGFGTISLSIQPVEIAPFDGNDGDSKPDDNVVARVRADANDTATMFAICADVSVKYVEKLKPSGANEVDSVKAKCPSDRHLVGGGASAGNKLLASSFPYDSQDSGNKPDDGWKATVYGAPATDIKAIAVCGAESADYGKTKTTLVPSAGTGLEAECDGNAHVSAIGGEMTGPQEFADLRSMHPQDDGDGDSVPDDNALVNMALSSLASESETMTAWAVCLG